MVDYDLENLVSPILTLVDANKRSSVFDVPSFLYPKEVGDISKGMAQADHKILSHSTWFDKPNCYIICKNFENSKISMGYVEAIKGIEQQVQASSGKLNFDDIVVACGSGKATYVMMKDMAVNPKKWEGRKILFVHTGGLVGLYDKVDQMSSWVKNWSRMMNLPQGMTG